MSPRPPNRTRCLRAHSGREMTQTNTPISSPLSLRSAHVYALQANGLAPWESLTSLSS